MNPNYWITIAQISATFIGLVFVGLSIYLKSIREAIDSINQLFGSSSGLQEKSSYLITSSMFSNMTFLLMPLTTALTIISNQKGLALLCLYILTNLILIGFLIYLFFNKRVSSERKTILAEKNKDRLLRIRLSYGNSIAILFIILFSVFTLGILYHGFHIMNQDRLTIYAEALCYLSILFGLGFNLNDIILFDVNSILFEVTADFEIMVDIIDAELYSEAFYIEPLYQRFSKSLECSFYHNKLEQINKKRPSDLKNIDRDEMLIKNDYQQIRSEVPKGSDPKMVQELRNKGRVLSFHDLHSMARRRTNVSEKIKMLSHRITNWLSLFEETTAK